MCLQQNLKQTQSWYNQEVGWLSKGIKVRKTNLVLLAIIALGKLGGNTYSVWECVKQKRFDTDQPSRDVAEVYLFSIMDV